MCSRAQAASQTAKTRKKKKNSHRSGEKESRRIEDPHRHTADGVKHAGARLTHTARQHRACHPPPPPRRPEPPTATVQRHYSHAPLRTARAGRPPGRGSGNASQPLPASSRLPCQRRTPNGHTTLASRVHTPRQQWAALARGRSPGRRGRSSCTRAATGRQRLARHPHRDGGVTRWPATQPARRRHRPVAVTLPLPPQPPPRRLSAARLWERPPSTRQCTLGRCPLGRPAHRQAARLTPLPPRRDVDAGVQGKAGAQPRAYLWRARRTGRPRRQRGDQREACDGNAAAHHSDQTSAQADACRGHGRTHPQRPRSHHAAAFLAHTAPTHPQPPRSRHHLRWA